jgi:phage terminase large subunit-like protein
LLNSGENVATATRDNTGLITDPELLAKVQEILRASESVAARILRLSPEEQEEFFAQFEPEELERLEYDWTFWARPNQIPPGPECELCKGNWINWLILAGRGWGKTRVGAEWIHDKVEDYGRVSLVGATAADARDIMVEGESGIMATARPWNKPTYYPSKTRIEWANGAIGLVFSAEEPDRLRGKQAMKAWADELAAWTNPEAWSQLQLGLRLGDNPQTVITTTPRPTKLVRELAGAPTTHVTKGITYENLNNLAPAYIQEVIRVFEGTRFGQQEIYADILDDAPGALWSRANIEAHRVTAESVKGKVWDRVVVAVDPATSVTEESDETGIIVVAIDSNREGYVLQDASGQLKPEQWANRVVSLYHSWDADSVVAEENQGGDMVRHTIQVYDPSVKVEGVRASKGKRTRAEPVSTLYEKGLVHHVGVFDVLERQLTTWDPGIDEDSPDRLDALVWGVSKLLVGDWAPRVWLFGGNELVGENPLRGVDGRKGRGRPEWVSPGSAVNVVEEVEGGETVPTRGGRKVAWLIG